MVKRVCAWRNPLLDRMFPWKPPYSNLEFSGGRVGAPIGKNLAKLKEVQAFFSTENVVASENASNLSPQSLSNYDAKFKIRMVRNAKHNKRKQNIYSENSNEGGPRSTRIQAPQRRENSRLGYERIDKDPRISKTRDTLNLLNSIQNDLSRLGGVVEPVDDFSSSSSSSSSSPLMHPALVKARSRFHQEKPFPGIDRTEFERAITVNPFAKLLASPLRMCALTGARLPVAFLAPFTLRKHPDTMQICEMPVGYHPIDYEKQSDEIQSTSTCPGKPINDSLPHDVSGNMHKFPSSQNVASLPSCHFLSTYEGLSTLSSLRPRDFDRTIPNRWRKRYGYQAMKGVLWRKDMALLVVELMRKKATRQLIHLPDQNPSLIVPWEISAAPSSLSRSISLQLLLNRDGEDQNYGAAVLWLGDSKSELKAQNGLTTAEKKATLFGPSHDRIQNPVIRLAGQGAMPALDIEYLIGKSNMMGLRKHSPIFHNEAVIITYSQVASDVLGSLWRLAAYLGDDSQTGISRVKDPIDTT